MSWLKKHLKQAHGTGGTCDKQPLEWCAQKHTDLHGGVIPHPVGGCVICGVEGGEGDDYDKKGVAKDHSACVGFKPEKSVTRRVFTYGVMLSREDEDRVVEMLRDANNAYNKHIEIYQKYQDDMDAVLSTDADVAAVDLEINDIKAKIASKYENIRSRRAHKRQRVEATEEELNGIDALYAELKAAYKKRSRAINKAKKTLEAELPEQKSVLREDAGATDTCYGGTWSITRDAAAAAKKATKQWQRLRFRRFVKDGQFRSISAFHKMSKTTTRDAIFDGTGTWLQIDPVPDWTFDFLELTPDERKPGMRADARKAMLTRMRMRVGSEGKNPVWLEGDIVYHRPLPKECEINTCCLARKAPGKFELQITVTETKRKKPCGNGQIEIDLRIKNTGSRYSVAKWRNDKGETGSLFLQGPSGKHFEQGKDFFTCMEKIERWSSYRTEQFNAFLEKLLPWMNANKDKLPESVLADAYEGRSTVNQWRSPRRFRKMLQIWRNDPAPKPEIWSLVEYTEPDFVTRRGKLKLQGWLHRDKHLEQYIEGARKRAHRFRREIYRKFANEMSSKYAKVVVRSYDLKKQQQSAHVLSSSGNKHGLRYLNKHAALSVLVDLLKQKTEAAGGVCDPQDIKGKTNKRGTKNEKRKANRTKESRTKAAPKRQDKRTGGKKARATNTTGGRVARARHDGDVRNQNSVPDTEAPSAGATRRRRRAVGSR